MSGKWWREWAGGQPVVWTHLIAKREVFHAKARRREAGKKIGSRGDAETRRRNRLSCGCVSSLRILPVPGQHHTVLPQDTVAGTTLFVPSFAPSRLRVNNLPS
jgi:hypothetical protein